MHVLKQNPEKFKGVIGVLLTIVKRLFKQLRRRRLGRVGGLRSINDKYRQTTTLEAPIIAHHHTGLP